VYKILGTRMICDMPDWNS